MKLLPSLRRPYNPSIAACAPSGCTRTTKPAKRPPALTTNLPAWIPSTGGMIPVARGGPISASIPDIDPLLGGPLRWDQDMDTGEQDYSSLTSEEVDELIDDASGFVTVLDDLRVQPLSSFNACYEIWTRIAKIPPAQRYRLLDELEPGAVRSLWKASMSRYVLDDDRSIDMFGDYVVWKDFPEKPRQIFEYSGKCERYAYGNRPTRFFEDKSMKKRYPGSTAWLRPSINSIDIPQERFKMLFFVHPTSGELYGRVLTPLFGPIDRWWGVPSYCRVNPELVLTPLQVDAGADMTLVYPDPSSPDPFSSDGGRPTSDPLPSTSIFDRPNGPTEGVASTSGFGSLSHSDLPYASWREPSPDAWSPFSRTDRDFVRVVAPGVYVGCAYVKVAEASRGLQAIVAAGGEEDTLRRKGGLMGGEGDYKEEDFVYFMFIRKTW